MERWRSHSQSQAADQNLAQGQPLVPLVFPAPDRPNVSVIIPVHDEWPVTRRCLAALLSAHNAVPYEVIVVDDASTDDTQQLSDLVAGITVVRNETNRGFLHSCNRGAEFATGEYVTFLNNDTEPAPRWLDEMLLVFRNFRDVGLVGSKLIYPDGRLQEAGGIVWSNGDPWNYGRGQDPGRPEFGYARQADYLSGASIMVERSTWQRVGGFSTEFAPAYFEDTDLAFKVHSIGRKVVFAPLSVVVHHEGISSGTDRLSGVKRYQEMNRPMFRAKWAHAIAGQPAPGIDPRLAAEHLMGQRRVLFVDRSVPSPALTGAGYESLQEMRLLQSLGYKVTVVPVHPEPIGPDIEYLQRMGVEVAFAPYVLGLDAFLKRRGSETGLVYLTDVSTAARALGPVRRRAPGAKIMLKLADLHPRAIRGQERRAIREVDVVLSFGGRVQAEEPTRALGPARWTPAPLVVDIAESVAPPTAREGIAFLGSRSHPPDRSALEFLCLEVMPLLRDRRPGTILHVYGSDWASDLTKRLAADDVSFEGRVPDAYDAVGTHRVAVSPVASGEGWRSRVAAALANGVPQVLSRMAQEGMGLSEGLEVCVAESPGEWADRIVMLCDDDVAWQSLSDASLRQAKEAYSFERGRSLMQAALEAVGEHPALTTVALVTRDARPDWSIR